ncbi:cytochrome c oxidase assembly protein [Actinophytocola glycyrrhizae]|uniref:Cytochrome c oxidase assembly protein n=1 Tax=Actinophytocola glycyrrhizae TaxID=2044873 RepID=A0ABV9S649_9PSEU
MTAADPLPLLVVVAALAVGYVAAAVHAGTGPRGWSRWRTASWLFGCAVAAVALSPVLAGHDPRAHMARHLLLGMVAPLWLVLAAPVTLLLRVTEPATGRRIGRVLRARPVHVLGHPATAALLSVGGLYAVMLTPLARAADTDPVLHNALHLHYLAAGYLFAWAIAGPDPAPRRPGMVTRVVVLVLAVAAHSVLAKLLYAHASTEADRAAAQLMYYGGDVAELALAAALFTSWYRRRVTVSR